MVTYPAKERYTADDLIDILRILRDPRDGCPWDKVQTHASIRMNFLEEAYEAVDAIDLQDPTLLCEELGDVLMQVAFHACIEQEAGRFGWEEVCDGVCRKLLDRHPNIFAGDPARQGINDWDMLKNMEKGRGTLQSELDSVPHALPALMRADKLQKRAARYGIGQPCAARQVQEGLQALAQAQAGSPEARHAAGRLLFAAVALARDAGVDAEQALQDSCVRFAANAKGDAAPLQDPGTDRG